MAGKEFPLPLKQNIQFDLLRGHMNKQNVGVTWFVEKVHILLPRRTNPTPTHWFPVRGCRECKRERFFPVFMKWHTTMKAASKPVGMSHKICSVLMSQGLGSFRNPLGTLELRWCGRDKHTQKHSQRMVGLLFISHTETLETHPILFYGTAWMDSFGFPFSDHWITNPWWLSFFPGQEIVLHMQNGSLLVF